MVDCTRIEEIKELRFMGQMYDRNIYLVNML